MYPPVLDMSVFDMFLQSWPSGKAVLTVPKITRKGFLLSFMDFAKQLRLGGGLRGFPERGLPERGFLERGLLELGLHERGLLERGLPERGLPERGLPERGLLDHSRSLRHTDDQCVELHHYESKPREFLIIFQKRIFLNILSRQNLEPS